MNTFTKILIILIFVMSLIYLGVTATLFSARVDFKNKFIREQEAHKATKGNADKEIARLNGDIESYKKEVNTLDNKLSATYTELTNTYSTFIELQSKFTDLLNDFNGLTARYEALAAGLVEQRNKNDELQKLVDENRNRKEQAELDRDTIQARLLETEDKLIKAEKSLAALEEQYVVMAKDLNSAKGELDFYHKRVPDIKPGEAIVSVEGKVLTVSEKVNLVIINVGKKDKVDVGMEFTVYRGDKFIGKIRIEKVESEWSSAMCLQEFMKERVQAGDNVATHVY